MLALFPGCLAPGGIQSSGRLAWEAIVASSRSSLPPFRLCYGDAGPADGPRPLHEFHTASKYRAVAAAASTRGRFGLVAVWHMDLLKLLPFLRPRGSRVVLILQGVEAWRKRPWPERSLLNRVDLFVSISDYTWRRFVGANPAFAQAPHCTVPLGIGAPWQGRIPSPGTPPAALMIGRLARGEDYKGHRQMLDAWPLVLRKIPTAELWIAGDGDLRPDLERYAAERGLGQSVRFWGLVSEAHKGRLLEAAHCLAVPSRGEGFGLVYLEAMRLGRPCLVSTLDAGREVVDPPRNGLAVDPDDRRSLAEATCRLLASGPEWQQWSTHARERYEQHFSASHYQQRLLSTLAGVRPKRI
ncbi:MAG: glycosyltransferase family 4 protein [Chloroflexota bacterium]|nr:glycosyltransferase family 4 protein [Chloroflexota bacterium]